MMSNENVGADWETREKSDISEQRCNMLMSDTVQYAVLSPSFFLRIHIVSCCCDSGSALLVDVLRIAVVYFMIRVLVGGCITLMSNRNRTMHKNCISPERDGTRRSADAGCKYLAQSEVS